MSHDTRVAALDSLLEDAGLDAVLATKDASIAYLTGFWGLQMERFFGVAVRRGPAAERNEDRDADCDRQQAENACLAEIADHRHAGHDEIEHQERRHRDARPECRRSDRHEDQP